jgi:GTP-binding protein
MKDFNITSIKFVKSAVDQFPEDKNIEFAFIGRSNVGKSSLINSITNNKKIARVSKTPGCTKLINFFLANNSFYIVDLPGYGFANISKSTLDSWESMVENYLLSSRNKIVFLLVDSRRGLKDSEMKMLNWMIQNNINYRLIYTKIDKLKRNMLRENIKNSKEDIFLSSHSNEGISEIISFMGIYVNKF